MCLYITTHDVTDARGSASPRAIGRTEMTRSLRHAFSDVPRPPPSLIGYLIFLLKVKNYESFPLANIQGEEEVGIMGSPPCMGIPLSVVGIFHISSQVLIYQYNIFSIEGPMKGYYFSERGHVSLRGLPIHYP